MAFVLKLESILQIFPRPFLSYPPIWKMGSWGRGSEAHDPDQTEALLVSVRESVLE